MPRNLSAAMQGGVQAQELYPALFVEAHFATGPIYVWNGLGAISWNGQTWTGLGTMGQISMMEESAALEAKGITLALSGFDSTWLTAVLSEFRLGLPAVVYMGLFDESGALISSPVVSWAGRMDQPTVDVSGETAMISINCENRLLDMNVAVDRRYTNEDQHLDYPNDKGFEFVNAIQEKTLYWGRTPNSTNII